MTDLIQINYWTDDQQKQTKTAEIPSEAYTTICAMRADFLVSLAAQYLDKIVDDPKICGVEVATVDLVEECARLHKNAETLPGGPRWNHCTAAAIAIDAIRECVLELNWGLGEEQAAIRADEAKEYWRGVSDRRESRQIRTWVDFFVESTLDLDEKTKIFCKIRSTGTA